VTFLSNPLCSLHAELLSLYFLLYYREPEVVMDPECRSRLRQDSAFFFRARSRSQNVVKKTDLDPESLFNFGSNRSLRGRLIS